MKDGIAQGWLHRVAGTQGHSTIQVDYTGSELSDIFSDNADGAMQARNRITERLNRDDWWLVDMFFLGYRIMVPKGPKVMTFDELKEEVTQLDAAAFEDLIWHMARAAQATYESTQSECWPKGDESWLKARFALAWAGSAVSERSGN